MSTLVRAALAAALVCSGCSAASSVLVQRPDDSDADRAVTAMWARDLRRVARSGDWILTRSYSTVGDVIALSTPGESLSHASVYDAERGTIIEAINPAVREVPLESLLARNRFVIVLRPAGLTEEARLASVERARAAVGVGFDYLGTVGLDDDERFYCSELVAWAAGQDDGLLVTPSGLMERGEVVYFSGARDDRQVRAAAVAGRALWSARAGARVAAR